MKTIKHFIWDFDGTLVDTYPNLVRYMALALSDFGITVEPDDILEKMLENIPYTIDFYTRRYNLTELSQRYDYHYSLGKSDAVQPFEGVITVLEQIQRNGGHNYIFTNRGETLDPMLDRLGLRDYFTEIIKAGDPEFEYKPSAKPILYLMNKYGGTPDNTAMVGDRKCDLESGYQAGCKTIHLLTPSVPQYPPCDWRISNFKEMLDMLK